MGAPAPILQLILIAFLFPPSSNPILLPILPSPSPTSEPLETVNTTIHPSSNQLSTAAIHPPINHGRTTQNKPWEDYPKEWDKWYVILAENASDVGITGGGVVDGQGLEFVVKFNQRKNVMVSKAESSKLEA